MFVSQIYLPFVLLEHLPGLVRKQYMTASDAVQTEQKAGPLPKILEIKYKLKDNRDMTRK